MDDPTRRHEGDYDGARMRSLSNCHFFLRDRRKRKFSPSLFHYAATSRLEDMFPPTYSMQFGNTAT